MRPALSDEPTTNETPLARAAVNMVERVVVVDHRILRGEQADIRVCHVQQLHDRFRRVHAEAPALDDPFLAHPRESREGALARNLELLLPRGRQIGIILRDVVHEDVQITSGLTPTTEVAPLFGHLVANGRAWLLWSFGHPGLPHFFTEISFAAMIVSVARVATKANHKIPILEAGD
jgi:hypothetical protein